MRRARGWVDLHCHFLPSLDDGPQNLDSSVAMLRLAHQDGTRILVATPHLFHPSFTLGRAEIEDCFESTLETFQSLAKQREDHKFLAELTFFLGAENHLTPELLAEVEKGSALTLASSRCLLVEPSIFLPPSGIAEAIRRALAAGYQPLLAHVERYPAMVEQPKRLEELVTAGCCLQVNAGTVARMGSWRRGRAIRRLFRKGWVHAVASDGHNTERRPPSLEIARGELERRYGTVKTRGWLADRPLQLLAEPALTP